MVAESKYQFERLTPIDNIESDVYEDAINYVFENPDVKNVANNDKAGLCHYLWRLRRRLGRFKAREILVGLAGR